MDIVSKQNNINAYTQSQQTLQAGAAYSNHKADSLTIEKPGDIVFISEQSKIQGKVDKLYQELDNIYLSHISASDKKTLEKAYKELDELYLSSQTTESQDRRAEELFSQIDKIFSAAESALSPQEKQKIDELNQQIDKLFEQYDLDFEEDLPDELLAALEPLEQELDGILNSKLSAEQKDKLDALHGQIGQLFDKQELSSEDEKAIEKAFDKIDSIMNKSFDSLSDEHKQRIEALELQIDGLFSVLDDFDKQSSGYYPV